jgi:hypothetical protein
VKKFSDLKRKKIEEEFLVVPPGYQVVASYDKEIIKAEKL